MTDRRFQQLKQKKKANNFSESNSTVVYLPKIEVKLERSAEIASKTCAQLVGTQSSRSKSILLALSSSSDKT